MCTAVIEKNNTDPTWLPNLWTSDEANFNLNGLVNSKNVLCYSPRGQGRPEGFSIETVKHPDGVMVKLLLYSNIGRIIFCQVFGALRLDGKKLPLRFYYPKWVNGERVSGTLDGDGYYKLLR